MVVGLSDVHSISTYDAVGIAFVHPIPLDPYCAVVNDFNFIDGRIACRYYDIAKNIDRMSILSAL